MFSNVQLATGPTAKWKPRLEEEGVQHEVVQDYPAFVDHPQPEAIGLFSWLTQDGSDEAWPIPNIPGMPKYEAGSRYATSSTIGQHTREILGELGYSADQVDQFFADKVVA